MNLGMIWTLFLRFANSVTDRKGRFFICKIEKWGNLSILQIELVSIGKLLIIFFIFNIRGKEGNNNGNKISKKGGKSNGHEKL